MWINMTVALREPESHDCWPSETADLIEPGTNRMRSDMPFLSRSSTLFEPSGRGGMGLTISSSLTSSPLSPPDTVSGPVSSPSTLTGEPRTAPCGRSAQASGERTEYFGDAAGTASESWRSGAPVRTHSERLKVPPTWRR